ncbi:MAG: ATP-binding protein [Woeseiaceae bacterium]|nr:ATP-binding protein [Woeseiaceae bacterium]
MPRTSVRRKKTGKAKPSGKLRIGDDWNAINIIALSQSNPLKAVAEFVENSIDANARNITITRGREQGDAYLRIRDDGAGLPVDEEGRPDFRYVATHICDSIKRQLKADGARGIQGEFGIGLLSFWTVGQGLTMTTAGTDGKTYQMHMQKGSPSYTLSTKQTLLFPDSGTELTIKPLLAGVRQLNGDKIQWYLASELRDRIRNSGVSIKVIDRTARREYKVEPRQFSGRLLHELPQATSVDGEIYTELYLGEADAGNAVGLYRSGTRVVGNLAELDAFAREPWTSGFLQGIVDASFVNLTPGTRTGVIQDDAFERFRVALHDVEAALIRIIAEQRRAEDERASRKMLNTIRKAFKEALLALPAEEYDWFEIKDRRPGRGASHAGADEPIEMEDDTGGAPLVGRPAAGPGEQKQFFEYAGPLFSVRVSPQSSVLPVGQSRTYRAVARDRSRITIDRDLDFRWRIVEGAGTLENERSEIVTFTAAEQPGLTRLAVTATQGDIVCEGEAIVTVTDTLLPDMKEPADNRQGLPGYTFRKAPGELWRSRYDSEQNVIVINNGHRDFVFASRNRSLKLRYICRLFAKEMVQKNFPGYSADDLLERMIELSLYTEENLR